MTSYPMFRQVVLDCVDARAAAEFYRQLLGLIYVDGEEFGPADWLVLGPDPDTRLIAFQQVPPFRHATWPDPGPDAVPQQLHLDFRVESVDELRAHHERVLELGGTLLRDLIDDPEEPIRIYADLDGHPFCLFTN